MGQDIDVVGFESLPLRGLDTFTCDRLRYISPDHHQTNQPRTGNRDNIGSPPPDIHEHTTKQRTDNGNNPESR